MPNAPLDDVNPGVGRWPNRRFGSQADPSPQQEAFVGFPRAGRAAAEVIGSGLTDDERGAPT